NDEQDRLLVAAAADGPAFILPTAAARSRPDLTVATAQRWFAGLGLEIKGLMVLKRTDANSRELAAEAATGGLFYLAGGDPGHLARTLGGTRVWEAIRRRWLDGAALAGSSAGAMALCEWTLIRAGWPNRTQRKEETALAVVPGTAVLPHYETFGQRWVPSARSALPGAVLLGIDERSAAVWNGSGWAAVGPGRVVIWTGDTAREFQHEPVEGLPSPTL
ncbi:MAG TPA: Type 1 glutamine amidotransferase-like domain-containing protein, partial [Candidatus Dormibacteraeota bacterium]